MSILGDKRSFDWLTIGIYFSLVIIGWTSVYSALGESQKQNSGFILSDTMIQHSIITGVALFFFLSGLIIDWKFWRTFAYVLYGIGILFLILVLLFGSEIKGAKAWFLFGGVSFQPSEFMKFGTALAVSSYLSLFKTNLKVYAHQFIAIGIICFPILLILLQPDAGSGIVFLSFFILLYREGLQPSYYIILGLLIAMFVSSLLFPMIQISIVLFILVIWVAYLNTKTKKYAWLLPFGVTMLGLYGLFSPFITYIYYLLIGLSLVSLIFLYRSREVKLSLFLPILTLILIGFGYFAFSFFYSLQSHQQERIKVWLKPDECDPRGSLYNLLQSKVAIGSGGLFGKGYLEGNMTKFQFVPEQSTDFIFSTIGEEQGFIGGFIIIALFLGLILRILFLAEESRNKFVRQYAYALAGLLFIHVFINIGMTMGIMPIIGIPLPLVSKGGSSLLVFSLMLGVLIRMNANRD